MVIQGLAGLLGKLLTTALPEPLHHVQKAYEAVPAQMCPGGGLFPGSGLTFQELTP